MNVLIIEDEKPAARHLKRRLEKVDPSIVVLNVIESIDDAVAWLETNPAPQLIFLDIQLADGLSFSLFERTKVESPIIFTTAFDEYALKAFQVKSIDYLLKPIEESDLRRALNKFGELSPQQIPISDLERLIRQEPKTNDFRRRFLIKAGEEFRYVQVDDIQYFQVANGLIQIKHSEGKSYLTDLNLEEVHAMLDPKYFFRVNRQQIVRIDAIQKMHSYFNGRLKLELDASTQEEFIVARDRVKEFRNWVDS